MAKGERTDIKALFGLHIIRPGFEPRTIYCPPGSQVYLVCPTGDKPLNPRITMNNIVALTDGLKIITRGTEGQYIIMLSPEKVHNKHKINMAIGINNPD